MRKVLSFVLVLSLVLGSFGMAFAAPLSDMAGEKSAEAVSVLTQLGVVKGYPDGTYKPGNIVTRAEMAVIVVSALGLADYATGTSSFSDMGGHWSNGYVAYATSLGIIAGYPDGTFKPDKTVSYDEAATMLVAALGYTPDSLVGTWPANYVTKAKVLGILDGIKAGAAGANRGDIAIMTYQTLDQQIGKTNKDGDWVGTVGDDMLTRLGATLNAAKVIDETDAATSVINLRPYIGASAAYYTNDDNDIIAIKVESTFLTGEYDAVANVFETDDVDYNVSAAVMGAAAVKYFTNGELDALFVAPAASTEYTIAVDVSGKTIKEVFSIAQWTVDQDDRVTDDDIDAIEDDTPKLLTETFALDDNDEIDLGSFDLVGVASLSDIKKDNIVYVYVGPTSADIAKVEVGTKVVTGEVTKVTTGGKYTIDGGVYEFADNTVYLGAATSFPSIGDEIKAYLDVNGDIYYYKTISAEADKYAVVLRTVAGSNDGALNATDTKVELFLADGTTKVFVVDEDALDDIDTGSANDPLTDTPPVVWRAATGDVVKYDVNSDGEINALTWVVDSGSKATAGVKDTNGGDYKAGLDLTAKGYFNGLAVSDTAVILTFDDALGFTTDDGDYGVGTLKGFLDTTIAEAWYVVKDGKIIFMYIDSTSTSADEVFGILTDKATVSSTSPKYEATMLVDGVSKTFASSYNLLADSYLTLYKITFEADGVTIKSLDNITTAPDYDYTATNSTSASVSGSVVTATFAVTDSAGVGSAATRVTLDSDVVVYVKNDAGTKYKVGQIRDISGKTGATFYDVNDDMVYDIVVLP